MHCLAPGTQVPVQSAFAHPNWHAAALTQLPVLSHVCGTLARHRLWPAVHAPLLPPVACVPPTLLEPPTVDDSPPVLCGDAPPPPVLADVAPAALVDVAPPLAEELPPTKVDDEPAALAPAVDPDLPPVFAAPPKSLFATLGPAPELEGDGLQAKPIPASRSPNRLLVRVR
jgi:hypothetical protein